ncbi:MAG TPA: hypothetical protein VEK07_18020 [Polyangiaceae bacterium]|nr:hypothetical protein [Polyangiaceae bacterium]
MSIHAEVLTPEQRAVLRASARLAQGWDAYLAGGAGLALPTCRRRAGTLTI